jgi:hypothetical protein
VEEGVVALVAEEAVVAVAVADDTSRPPSILIRIHFNQIGFRRGKERDCKRSSNDYRIACRNFQFLLSQSILI